MNILQNFEDQEVKLDRWKTYIRQLENIKSNLEKDLEPQHMFEDYYEKILDKLIKNLKDEVVVLDYKLRDKI